MSAELEQIGKRVAAVLGTDASFVLLFGSVTKSTFAPDSDVDVAALFVKRPTDDDRLRLRDELVDALARPVDLIVLNDADIIIAMQALANGVLVGGSEPSLLAPYKARKVSEYIDFKRARKVVEDSLMRRPNGAGTRRDPG